jgi:hypothetical protein
MGKVPNRRPAVRFEDLVVWPRAHARAHSIYQLSTTFPKSEAVGLVQPNSPCRGRGGRQHRRGVPAEIDRRKSAIFEYRPTFATGAALHSDSRRIYLKFGETINLREDVAKVGRLIAAYMRGIERSMDPSS